MALEFVSQLGIDLQDASCPPEIRKLGRTITRWRTQIAAGHQAHVSNGALRKGSPEFTGKSVG